MSDQDEILKSDKSEPVEIGDVDGPDHYILQAEIESVLKEAEAFRLEKMTEQRSREFMSLTIMLCSVVLGAGAFAWYLLVMGNILMALLCMLVAVIPHFFLSGWVNKPIKDYKKEFKGTFMTRLAKTFGKFEYFQNRGISRKILAKTSIVPAHENYRAEDCFYGTKNGVKITLSEARLASKTKKGALSFDGIFTLFEYPNDMFDGHTIITSDPGLAKRMAQKLSVIKDPDSTYGNHFTTLSSSASPSSFLKPELYQTLDMIRVKFDNCRLSATLLNKKYLFVMIPDENDMFEASDMYAPVASNEAAKKCKSEVEQLFSIMDLAKVYSETDKPVQTEDNILPETNPSDSNADAHEMHPEDNFNDASEGDPVSKKPVEAPKSPPEE